MDLQSPDNLINQPNEAPANTTVTPPDRPTWFKKSNAVADNAIEPAELTDIANEDLNQKASRNDSNIEPPKKKPTEKQSSRRQRLARVAGAPKLSLAPEEEPELTSWQTRLKLLFLSVAAGSYGVSLLIHILGLVGASAWLIYDDIVSEATIVTVLPSDSLDDLDLEEALDAKMDAQQQNESAPSVLSQLVPVQKDSDRFVPQDVATGFAQKNGDGENLADGFADSFKFRMPSNGKAIVKGSFAAWTVPEDPQAGEDYKIIIQIKVPKKLRRYRVTDLSGQVRGTDGFRHTVPYDSRRPNATKTERGKSLSTVTTRSYLPIKNGVAQLIISIPGAAKLVEDTIEIRSRALKESQELKIVF